ncbi:HesB/YadR/YfhF family protein [Tenuibacillus multivorans]|uniref:Uncharacterized protein YneR n=1 Tax=Tenuibacillus multivorans TaxID=237069 RepID=A0A1G9WSL7_9BACI|nr:hypothetical protein [Tenuibacillus multivorans]GEL78438.1 hypothetical protein TMU01_26730 [Tenuibacillus multivorans]SDM87572.1 Uncharacterized protein YneR [Tenuibacillus multivorans]
MNIHIEDQAIEWFMDEMDLDEGDVVRFYPKYGGTSVFQDGFSVAMDLSRANKPTVETEKQNISFQIDEKDVWFFKDQDLYIGLKGGEVAYSNEPINE